MLVKIKKEDFVLYIYIIIHIIVLFTHMIENVTGRDKENK